MKNKVLLSTLLGSALLVGCTADDALDVKKNVVEGVNPAAPVFTVSFGDDLTRASMATDGVHAMTWESIDKMSLYYGGGDNHGKISDSDNFLKTGVLNDFNAVYGMSGGEGGTPEFTTAAMVKAGLAIMVYPADTIFEQKGQNPIIELEMEQTPETKNKTPHISEIVDIKEYDPNDAHSAGYGRKYDIIMRQIGAQLRLTLVGTDNEKLQKLNADVKFRKVTMAVDQPDHSPFTKKLEVKIGQERRYVNENGETKGSTEVGKNTEDHEYWKYSPWMEPAAVDGTVSEISTTDIDEETGTAIFTLLPYDDMTDKANSAFDEAGDPLYGDVTITVETNYGKVKIADPEHKAKLWYNNGKAIEETLEAGLARFLKQHFVSEDKGEDGLYSGQILPGGGSRYLSVDLSDLDMKNLHVKNADELTDVLNVYDALKKDTKDNIVTFILDGEKDGVNKGKFVMNKTQWEALETRLADNNNKVSFALCAGEAPCEAIVLDNTGNDAAEVPALQFATTAPDGAIVKSSVNVELVGKWKYAKVTDNKNTNDQAKIKNLVINDLVVTKGSEITLENYIAAKGANVKIVVENGATAIVSGVVTLQVDMDNKGTLDITEDGSQLAVDEETTLNNLEPQGLDATGWQKDANKGGVVNLKGTLAIVDQTTGKINNYGTIDVKGGDARILITKNAYDGADASKPFTNTQQVGKPGHHTAVNVFGVIFLNEKIEDTQLTVKLGTGEIKTNTGFIKYDKTANAITKANYYIIKGDAGYATKQYVEVDSSVTGELTAVAGDVDVLILPQGKKMFCPVVMEVIKSLYVKGTITHTGGFKYGTDKNDKSRLTGYFGGDVNDYTRIFSDGVIEE